jgi:hypothetical protein
MDDMDHGSKKNQRAGEKPTSKINNNSVSALYWVTEGFF